MLSNAHTMMLLMTFLAKPMFKVNKPLFIMKQTMDVMVEYSRVVKEYFAIALNNIHMEKIYIY
jgi:hypothetical protein